MDPYKPQYLGKVMPESPPSLTNFMQTNYEQFSKTFDTCKSESAGITNITNTTQSGQDALTVKVTANKATIGKLTDNVTAANDDKIKINGNEITVDPDDKK